MNRVLCPHCHVVLDSGDAEEIAIAGHRYVICPECDTPLPLPDPPPAPTADRPPPEAPDA